MKNGVILFMNTIICAEAFARLQDQVNGFESGGGDGTLRSTVGQTFEF